MVPILFMFVLYVVGLVWSAVHFLRHAINDHSWASLLPLVGSVIGLYWGIRLAIFLVKHADQMILMGNIAQNIATIFSIKSSQDPSGARRAVEILGVDPKTFKRNLAAQGVTVPVGSNI